MVKSASNRASEQAVQTVRPLNNNSANSLGGPEGFDEQVRNILSAAQAPNLSPSATRQTRKPRTTTVIAIAIVIVNVILVCFFCLCCSIGRRHFIWVYPCRAHKAPHVSDCHESGTTWSSMSCVAKQLSNIEIAKDMFNAPEAR